MLTTKQFSEASGVPVGTLKRWRSKPRGNKCEGRQGVLIPAHVDEHGNVFYSEEQIEIARRLHNPNYGIPKLFEVNNTMTENTALDAQIDAQAANQAVDNQTPADAQNDATSDDKALIVDDEFKALIPPLAEIERQQLEENLLHDGIRDPLVVWQGHGIIVDGHNRFSIAQKHGLHFKTTEMHFADRDAVKVWIVQNQFGRRNINRYSRGELALKLEPSIAAAAKANQGTRTDINFLSTLTESCSIDTRTELAKIAGVSTGTMAKIKYLVDNATDEIKAALRADELTINAAFKGVKTGAKTVEHVRVVNKNLVHSDDDAESPSPKTARENVSKTVDKPVEHTAASTSDVVEDGPIDGERICDGKISAIVTATADDDVDSPTAQSTVDAAVDDSEEIADVPNQHVHAQGFDDDDTLEVNHSTDDTNAGDDDDEINRVRMVHNDVRRLIVRVEHLIWDADFDKLTVAKDTLARLVAALETKTPAVDADGQAYKFR